MTDLEFAKDLLIAEYDRLWEVREQDEAEEVAQRIRILTAAYRALSGTETIGEI